MKRSCSGAAMSIALMGLTAPAMGLAASSKTATPPPVVQQVLDCRKLTEGDQRLACYDKAVDGMAQAQAKGDLVTVDRQQRQALHHQAFGFNLPALSFFSGGEKSEELNEITAKVSSASLDASGKWVIRLDDGAVWHQVDDTALEPDPHAGSAVSIRKGLAGGYFMNIDRQQAFRARREN
jgi:hypothetical protein